MTVEASFAANVEKPEFSAVLLGTKGGADVMKAKLFTEDAGTLWDREPYGLSERLEKGYAHFREMELFIEAVRRNKPVPVPGTEALITQKILNGIYKSAEIGREVRIR